MISDFCVLANAEPGHSAKNEREDIPPEPVGVNAVRRAATEVAEIRKRGQGRIGSCEPEGEP